MAEYIQKINSLEAFDIHPDHPIYQTFIFNNRQRMDYTWVDRQIAYINGLSERDKHIIMSYTIYGDILINSHIRGTLTLLLIKNIITDVIKHNPFKYQHQDETNTDEIDKLYIENIPLYIIRFIKEYDTIIQNAPSLTKKIIVYRGLNDILHGVQRNSDQYFHQKEFISASFYLPAAVQFMKKSYCILELEVDTNVKCLLSGYVSKTGKFDITFAPNTLLINLDPVIKLVLDDVEHYKSSHIFIYTDKYDVHSSQIYTGELIQIKIHQEIVLYNV